MGLPQNRFYVVIVLLLLSAYFFFLWTVPGFNLDKIHSRKDLFVSTMGPFIPLAAAFVFLFGKKLYERSREMYAADRQSQATIKVMTFIFLLLPLAMLTLMSAKTLSGGILTPIRWLSSFVILMSIGAWIFRNVKYKYDRNSKKIWITIGYSLIAWLYFVSLINLVDLMVNAPFLFKINL